MEERLSSPRFDIVLCVKLNIKEGGTLRGTLGNLSSSGEDIMVRCDKDVQEGKPVIVEIPVPAEIRNIQCEGKVISCNQTNGVYEIDVHIHSIDEQVKKGLQAFCNFLTPVAGSDIVKYLIQEAEKALGEASEVVVGKAMNKRLGALIHELLALRYHDALRSFEDALKLEPENEVAVEGFCYSLAKAISHYERAGLSGLADTIKTKAMLYYTDKTLDIAKGSPRISKYLLEVITP